MGTLPLVILKMSLLDKDEKGRKRIPILLECLKISITDCLSPQKHSVFKIELEYGNGIMKWVVYRQLRDFVNLHAHYRVNNSTSTMPPFPKSALTYLNWKLTSTQRQDFIKAQMQSLESYLHSLVKANLFSTNANRICRFFEISAMSLELVRKEMEYKPRVPSSDTTGKQGFLRILSPGISRQSERSGFHPILWGNRHSPKWLIVRDSYVLAVDDPSSTRVFDVFLYDSEFEIERPKRIFRQGLHLLHDSEETKNPSSNELSKTFSQASMNDNLKNSSNHTFYITNRERRVRLVGNSERHMDQFIASIERMVLKTPWTSRNRFGSFAPVRHNVAAQWLVDGRDYYWSLSRAILLAKSTIYIHDWWLSPELYLRRPPAENEKWRLDRLLKKKAEQGVQIFVIVYKEVSNEFTPVESYYTKMRLRKLHPNIHVQRSPSHTKRGTLFWSHHEKLCVIDETISFMGGLDLCFGRWDSPEHVLIDDGLTGLSPEEIEKILQSPDAEEQRKRNYVWPGKDYANEREANFTNLTKPFEDMFDRDEVVRQPWHDIGIQIMGQPARDLCRHFVQRWNYLLRNKNHSIEMPFLVPAPDFTLEQLKAQRIEGTCEVQICRSSGQWSLGLNETEHSIQNAYVTCIENSDHFVYIENQFFISSTEAEGVEIENGIGDALVERIIRAHRDGVKWRAIIVIPLLPGYPCPLDHSDAGSVRLICECQYRTICRGSRSIYERLREHKINPEDYILFFSLRAWAKHQNGRLTTEAVYIHAKTMVVDDRIALIGSANINERSQRGDRDSEIVSVIRDTDMIEGTMGGKPYKMGRFAHSLRLRLMWEHAGVDMDDLLVNSGAVTTEEPAKPAGETLRRHATWDPDHEQEKDKNRPVVRQTHAKEAMKHVYHSAEENLKLILESQREKSGFRRAMEMSSREGSEDEEEMERVGRGGVEDWEREEAKWDREERRKREVEDYERAGKGKGPLFPVYTRSPLHEKTENEGGVGDVAEKHMENGEGISPQNGAKTELENGAEKTPHSGSDEAIPSYKRSASASRTRRSTSEQIGRRSRTSSPNRSSPLLNALKRTASPFQRSSSPTRPPLQRSASPTPSRTHHDSTSSGRSAPIPNPFIPTTPPFSIEPNAFVDPISDDFFQGVWLVVAHRNTEIYRKVFRCSPDDQIKTWSQFREWTEWQARHKLGQGSPFPDLANVSSANGTSATMGSGRMGPFSAVELEHMEAALEEVHGNLVLFPTRFLEVEMVDGNFLFSKDHIPPLAIYD